MTDATLKTVTNLGALGYAPADIATILQVPQEDIAGYMMDEASSFYKAYFKGYYETDIKLRNSIFRLANAGSGPAQVMAANILKKTEGRNFYE